MSARMTLLVAGAIVAAGALTGCDPAGAALQPAPDKRIVLPPHVAGTVGEYAALTGGRNIDVQGHGIVVALGTNGSSEVPAHLQKYLHKYLTRQKIGLWSAGTQDLTPELLLRDRDTAVVLIAGAIPPGAPQGSTFDVFLAVPPQTQTRSLEGGLLMPVEMHLAWQGVATPGGPSFVWAESAGPVFVNPFLDPAEPADQAKMRTGKVIGGGRVKRPRPPILQLRQPDYPMLNLILRRINQRFGGNDRWTRIAKSKGKAIIELTIPKMYRTDYEHFIELVMHLPIRVSGAAWENQARRVAKAMELPEVNHHELALVWEAMGRQVLPVVQQLYSSTNDASSFYSARSGLRLGDRKAVEVILRFARHANSPLQLEAIEELGRHKDAFRAVPVLRELIDDESELVRVASYEALVEHGDRSRIRRVDVGGAFTLDLVTSSRKYVIYATQRQRPRLVLFGKDMTVSRPVFFSAPDGLVTIASGRKHYTLTEEDVSVSDVAGMVAAKELGNRDRGDEIRKVNPTIKWDQVGRGQRVRIPPTDHLMVFRKIPRTGRMSDVFYMDFKVSTLVAKLASPAERGLDGKIRGLALTYGQTLSVLYRMCQDRDIDAKFVLQPPSDVQRIYPGAAAAGRANMPGE